MNGVSGTIDIQEGHLLQQGSLFHIPLSAVNGVGSLLSTVTIWKELLRRRPKLIRDFALHTMRPAVALADHRHAALRDAERPCDLCHRRSHKPQPAFQDFVALKVDLHGMMQVLGPQSSFADQRFGKPLPVQQL